MLFKDTQFWNDLLACTKLSVLVLSLNIISSKFLHPSNALSNDICYF